ncbi:MAG: hypothetical protein AB8B73_12535 [Ekhidna sp.]
MSIVVEAPFSYYIFDKLVLDNLEYTIDVDFWEIGGGVLFIIILALTKEASQTLNTAKSLRSS